MKIIVEMGIEGITDWCVTVIDQVEDKKEFKMKELYWINKLNAWASVGLNVREVYKTYWIWTFYKEFLADEKKGWKCLNLYFISFLTYLYCYFCFNDYYCYHYYNINFIIVIMNVIIIFVIAVVIINIILY